MSHGHPHTASVANQRSLDMAIFYKLLRFLCLCIVMQKGSWTPQQNFTKKRNVVAKKRFKEKKKKDVDGDDSAKPEWLKQWTISKGWMHNRSHLLNLGLDNVGKEEEVVEIATPKPCRRIWGEEKTESSSVSIEDVDDLLSLDSEVEVTKRKEDLDKIDVCAQTLPLENKTKEDNDIFAELSRNYRRNFPDHFDKYDDFQLPEIYKERLLFSKHENASFLTELWEYVKPKRKTKENKNCKFTVNQLYDSKEVSIQNEVVRSKPFLNTLGQNIALYNTMNAKTNLLEDTIYECSEDSNSLYHNPIYTSAQDNRALAKYYDFHTNHAYKPDSFVRRRYRLANTTNNKFNSMKYRAKTEKYIIRHIKVRIMLSLRIGRFQKLCNKREVSGKTLDRQALLFKSGAECCENFSEEQSSLRRRIVRAHEEQRRIGNGRTSMKIQNMRYCHVFNEAVFFAHSLFAINHSKALLISSTTESNNIEV